MTLSQIFKCLLNPKSITTHGIRTLQSFKPDAFKILVNGISNIEEKEHICLIQILAYHRFSNADLATNCFHECLNSKNEKIAAQAVQHIADLVLLYEIPAERIEAIMETLTKYFTVVLLLLLIFFLAD